MDRVRTPVEGLVGAGAEPVFAFYLENQVDDKLTIGGVNSAHYTGDFAYTNLECTSYWQINLDGLKLNGAAVGSTPYAIVDSGTSFLAKPTTDVKSIAAWFSLLTTIGLGLILVVWTCFVSTKRARLQNTLQISSQSSRGERLQRKIAVVCTAGFEADPTRSRCL